ncbi:hypothetical protein CBR_g31259 [Chara braunii]|uniref:Uncharacterized protein n=1 Tax=Chara braunii TaxID=69332 RepID=A0A388JY40_CHABU|nr:hypothetical protein CBR_g31259 [Chara braunii]|eukprot:GBG62623.1 hypothetical protein CBR_g31259 [Chara braunii]
MKKIRSLAEGYPNRVLAAAMAAAASVSIVAVPSAAFVRRVAAIFAACPGEDYRDVQTGRDPDRNKNCALFCLKCVGRGISGCIDGSGPGSQRELGFVLFEVRRQRIIGMYRRVGTGSQRDSELEFVLFEVRRQRIIGMFRRVGTRIATRLGVGICSVRSASAEDYRDV